MDRIKRYINSENYSEESNGSNASTSEYCDSDLSDTETNAFLIFLNMIQTDFFNSHFIFVSSLFVLP